MSRAEKRLGPSESVSDILEDGLLPAVENHFFLVAFGSGKNRKDRLPELY